MDTSKILDVCVCVLREREKEEKGNGEREQTWMLQANESKPRLLCSSAWRWLLADSHHMAGVSPQCQSPMRLMFPRVSLPCVHSEILWAVAGGGCRTISSFCLYPVLLTAARIFSNKTQRGPAILPFAYSLCPGHIDLWGAS